MSSIEHYYPPSSTEHRAWKHVERYTHTHHVTSLDIAYAARYEAVKLFLTGDGVYIPPRTAEELIELLQRSALSYIYTHISYLRTPATLPSQAGTDASKRRLSGGGNNSGTAEMKSIAYDGLRQLVKKSGEEMLRLYEGKEDWFDSPRRAALTLRIKNAS
ncbi:hypothetical protein CPB86DRAFT_791834 [Serendipita vermifera]|nr:hypothetical protein CPB86DRAFT_791834 [Serendipita vermifera]